MKTSCHLFPELPLSCSIFPQKSDMPVRDACVILRDTQTMCDRCGNCCQNATLWLRLTDLEKFGIEIIGPTLDVRSLRSTNPHVRIIDVIQGYTWVEIQDGCPNLVIVEP